MHMKNKKKLINTHHRKKNERPRNEDLPSLNASKAILCSS